MLRVEYSPGLGEMLSNPDTLLIAASMILNHPVNPEERLWIESASQQLTKPLDLYNYILYYHLIDREAADMQIPPESIAAILKFGTEVFSQSTRYVIEVPQLPRVSFLNPKDAGTDYCTQTTEGNGADIILLNGLTETQQQQIDQYLAAHDPATWNSQADIDTFMAYCDSVSVSDRYCSDVDYRAKNMTQDKDRVWRRTKKDKRRAAKLRLGTKLRQEKNGSVMTQTATVDGALLIVDAQGNANITNVPSDYQTEDPNQLIVTLESVLSQSQQSAEVV